MKMNDKETINYQYYLHDYSFKEKSNFTKYWNQMQSYYEGDQYTNKLNNKIPKCVINFCKFLILNKASKIIGTPYTIAFQTAGNDMSTLKLQHFYKFTLLTMGDDTFNYDAVVNGLLYGQEITYITFDEDYTTYKAFKKGGLKEISIDPRKFAVSNPHEKDIQKQKWLMYWNDEEVGSIREMCQKMKGESDADFKKRVSSILPDNYRPDLNGSDREDVAFGLATVYTRFFRIDGEVYQQASTQDVYLYDPQPLSLATKIKSISKIDTKTADELGDKVADYEAVDRTQIDTQITDKSDFSDKEYTDTLSKFSMYPFAVYRPMERMNHFYGISELQDVIGSQQVINLLPSLAAQDIKTNALGKYVAKKDALKGQKIKEESGEVIYDYSNINGYGIKRLEGTSMATNIMDYTQTLLSIIRTITGTTEVFTGDMSRDLSGTAIQLLQEQGNTTIEQQQKNFNNDYCCQKAKIIFQFFMHYVDEETYLYERSESEYESETMYRNKVMELDKSLDESKQQEALQNGQNYQSTFDPSNYPEVNHIEQETFESAALRNKIFYVQPKSGRGIKYSEIIQADFLQNILLNGGIEKYSADQLQLVMELLPLVDDTTKANVQVQIEKMRNSELEQAKQQNTELQQQLAQAAQINQKYQTAIEYYKNLTKGLTDQYKQQLGAAKQQVTDRDNILKQYMPPQGQGTAAQPAPQKTGSATTTKPTSVNNLVKQM